MFQSHDVPYVRLRYNILANFHMVQNVFFLQVGRKNLKIHKHLNINNSDYFR